MKTTFRAAFGCLALLVCGVHAAAQDMAGIWQDLARLDSEAALRLIKENHPGAQPELGDEAFMQRLEIAREHLAERLPLVKDYPGYSAVLAGLANDFGDGHIWSSAQYSQNRLDWPGLVAERRGGRWFVGHDLNEGGELSGAEILSCDGKGADEVGRERLGQFRADADVEASLASEAYALFIDDGNPFLARPKACRFELADGTQVDRDLPWQTAARSTVVQQIGQVLSAPSAGLDVSPFAGGYWIGLGTLSPEAEPLVARVEALQHELRSVPMVVVDLRGNGGGNSAYSDAIATALAGEEALSAVAVPMGDCMGAFWRASPGNAAAMRELGEAAEGERRDWLLGIADDLDAARAAGEAFSPDLPACAKEVANVAPGREVRAPQLAMKGRLVLLTDKACFSSCLIAADTFRRLGALHVGEVTDRSTRYMEVREELLPSGLRTFSTLMKLALGLGDYGPYSPDIPYTGSLGDDEALKAWVAALPASD